MEAEQIAQQAAERVREVIAEAERRAAEIVREAEAKASGIRERAEADARERIERARAALSDAVGGQDDAQPPPQHANEPLPGVEGPPTDPLPGVEGSSPPPDSARAAPTGGAETGPSAANGDGDDTAARLMAMKMALDGRGRDEIASELESKFGAADRGALLDDVLARAGR
jgi:hypothetical protein